MILDIARGETLRNATPHRPVLIELGFCEKKEAAGKQTSSTGIGGRDPFSLIPPLFESYSWFLGKTRRLPRGPEPGRLAAKCFWLFFTCPLSVLFFTTGARC